LVLELDGHPAVALIEANRLFRVERAAFAFFHPQRGAGTQARGKPTDLVTQFLNIGFCQILEFAVHQVRRVKRFARILFGLLTRDLHANIIFDLLLQDAFVGANARREFA
jgi:hypothetical protein